MVLERIHTGFLALVVIYMWQTASGSTMSACFSANRSLDVDCGEGYMIRITRTFYGFSPTGQCRLMEGMPGSNCTVEDQTNYPCVGQRTCSINLPTGQWGVRIPACNQRSNYFQVEYTCVLARSVSDICQNDQLTSQSGYIMTPGYPINYKQSNCSISIVVNTGQKLNLLIIDMDLEAKGRTDCSDSFYFNDGLRSITLCGQRINSSYNMHSNRLIIELRSTSGRHSKGFWLFYEAVPRLPPLPSLTEDHSTLSNVQSEAAAHNIAQTNDNEWHDSITTYNNTQFKNTVPLYRNTSRSTNQLPFAAIASSVIGTLSLILVILLILLFIKWYREKKYYKSEKILEIRNPAFRSSNDFQEITQSNNSFYC